jgi:hypothetical protein
VTGRTAERWRRERSGSGQAANPSGAAGNLGGRARGGGRGVNQWDMIGRKNGELREPAATGEDVYQKTSDGWRQEAGLIPSKRGANPAPLAPRAFPLMPTKAFSPPLPPTSHRPDEADHADGARLSVDRAARVEPWSCPRFATARRKRRTYASLYTPDAAFAGAVGHDQLVALARARLAARLRPPLPDQSRHGATPDGGAKGKEYLVVFDIRENGEPVHLSRRPLRRHVYEDAGWLALFKTRLLVPAAQHAAAGATARNSRVRLGASERP